MESRRITSSGVVNMIIFWRKSLIMLSVPKTGTHSYIEHLQQRADIVIKHPQNMKHMGLKQIRNKILPILPKMRGEIDYFGYVRNPVDWLWSWYCYRSRPEIRGRISSTADISFSGFVKSYLEPNPPPYANVGRQSSVVTSTHPSLLANMLFKYENHREANAYLSDKIGSKVSPDKILNKSPQREKSISRGDISLLEREIPTEFEIYESAR